MNMLLIICPEARQEDMRNLIHHHGVHAYTEMTNVLGEGHTGPKLGTHFHSQKSVLLFLVMEESKEAELLAALRTFRAGLYPDEGLRAFTLPANEVL
ncbi:MAG: hypothetical protein NTV49_12490 [Kiritimatiellaeota bacterium]|nr:hypothetical protein [Kiritimatiellota bacterium]